MSARARKLLEWHFAESNAFPIGPRRVQKLVKVIANRAKVSQEVTPHVLRHTFAALSIQKGMNLPALKKVLGHDRLTTTEIYLNVTDRHIQEEYEQKW
jgi:integrase/recombinase XerD